MCLPYHSIPLGFNFAVATIYIYEWRVRARRHHKTWKNKITRWLVCKSAIYLNGVTADCLQFQVSSMNRFPGWKHAHHWNSDNPWNAQQN
jgi:hypothetical protein